MAGLSANAWSALLGLLALPVLINGLGAEGFGITALTLSLLSTAVVGNFGLGRAAAKYIAEELEEPAKGDNPERYVHTGLSMTVGLAAIASVLLFLVTPLLVDRLLRIPSAFMSEAHAAFRLTAVGLPAIMLTTFFNGILNGHSRMVVLNMVLMGSSTARFAGAIAVVFLGYTAKTVVLVYVIVAYTHCAALFVVCFLGKNSLAHFRLAWEPGVFKKLLAFGTWGTATNGLARILSLTDKWVLGALVSLEMVGYYTIAREICARQTYITGAISRAFFPVFSGQFRLSPQAFSRSYVNASKAVIGSTTGLGILLACFAKPLLATWVSAEAAAHAGGIMAILAIAFLLESYGWIAAMAVTAGPGRPDLVARAYTVAVIVQALGSVVGALLIGVAGVALSLAAAYAIIFWSLALWLTRNGVDVPLPQLLASFALPCAAAGLGISLPLVYASESYLRGLPMVLTVLVVAYLAYLAVAFHLTYSATERVRIRRETLRLFAGA